VTQAQLDAVCVAGTALYFELLRITGQSVSFTLTIADDTRTSQDS